MKRKVNMKHYSIDNFKRSEISLATIPLALALLLPACTRQPQPSRVEEVAFPGGSEGGKQGPNTVPPEGWDGTNDAGQKVSKGGYLAQIKVGGSKGSTTVIRKIGVIH